VFCCCSIIHSTLPTSFRNDSPCIFVLHVNHGNLWTVFKHVPYSVIAIRSQRYINFPQYCQQLCYGRSLPFPSMYKGLLSGQRYHKDGLHVWQNPWVMCTSDKNPPSFTEENKPRSFMFRGILHLRTTGCMKPIFQKTCFFTDMFSNIWYKGEKNTYF